MKNVFEEEEERLKPYDNSGFNEALRLNDTTAVEDTLALEETSEARDVALTDDLLIVLALARIIAYPKQSMKR